MAAIQISKMLICMVAFAVAWDWPVPFGEKEKTGAHEGSSVNAGSTEAHLAWVGAMGEVSLAAELGGLKLTQLRKRAVAAGASADQVDEAEDSDNPKAALTSMIERLAGQPPAKAAKAVASGGVQFRGSESAGTSALFEERTPHNIRLEPAEHASVEMKPSFMDGLEDASAAHEAREHDTKWATKAYAFAGKASGQFNPNVAQHFFDQVMRKDPDEREREYHSIMKSLESFSLIEGLYHDENGTESPSRSTLSEGNQKIWPTLEYSTPHDAQTWILDAAGNRLRRMTAPERDLYWQKYKAQHYQKRLITRGPITQLDPNPRLHPLSRWTFLDNVEASYVFPNRQCLMSTRPAADGSGGIEEMWLDMPAKDTTVAGCLALIYANRHLCSLDYFNYDEAAYMPLEAIEVSNTTANVVGKYKLDGPKGHIQLCITGDKSSVRDASWDLASNLVGVDVWGKLTSAECTSITSSLNLSSIVDPYISLTNDEVLTITAKHATIPNMYSFTLGSGVGLFKDVIIPRAYLKPLDASGNEIPQARSEVQCGCVSKHAKCSKQSPGDVIICDKKGNNNGAASYCGKHYSSGTSMKVYQIVAAVTHLAAYGSSPRALCAATENYDCTYFQGDRSCVHRICGNSMIMRPDVLLKCKTTPCLAAVDQKTCCVDRARCTPEFCKYRGATPKTWDDRMLSKFFCAGTTCEDVDRGTCCTSDTKPTDPFAIKVLKMESYFGGPQLATKCKHIAPLIRVNDTNMWPGTGQCSKVFASHPRLVAGGYDIPDGCGSNLDQLCTHIEQVKECGPNMDSTCSCLEYCARLNLPSLFHPECPNDVCDVAVETKAGWCHFYTTYGCSIDDDPVDNREITNGVTTLGDGTTLATVDVTNVLWRMKRTCDLPTAFVCPLNSHRKSESAELGNVQTHEANLAQCCECNNGGTYNPAWYQLKVDGCLMDHPGTCQPSEVYDLANVENCVAKTCGRYTDTSAQDTQSWSCVADATNGVPGSLMDVVGSSTIVNPEYHTCCQCTNTQTQYTIGGESLTLDDYYPPVTSLGCIPLVICTDAEYENVAPSNGATPGTGTNRECLPFTVCRQWEVELVAPTDTTDRICGVDQFYVTSTHQMCPYTMGDDADRLISELLGETPKSCQRACTLDANCNAATYTPAPSNNLAGTTDDSKCALLHDCPSPVLATGGRVSFTKDFQYLWNSINSATSEIKLGDLVIEHETHYHLENNDGTGNNPGAAAVDGREVTFKPCAKEEQSDSNGVLRPGCEVSPMPIQVVDITLPFYFDRVVAASKIKLTATGAVPPYDMMNDGLNGATCQSMTEWGSVYQPFDDGDGPKSALASTQNNGNKGFVMFGTPHELIYGGCGIQGKSPVGKIEDDDITLPATTLQRRTNTLRVSTGQSDYDAGVKVDLTDVIVHRLGCATPNQNDATSADYREGGVDSLDGELKEVAGMTPWNDGGAWYDVQGCGLCFDWCRWVIEDAMNNVDASSTIKFRSLVQDDEITYGPSEFSDVVGIAPYWSCRLAGTDTALTSKDWLKQFAATTDGPKIWPISPCARQDCPISGNTPIAGGADYACMCDPVRGKGANDCRSGQYCYKTDDAGDAEGPTCNDVSQPVPSTTGNFVQTSSRTKQDISDHPIRAAADPNNTAAKVGN